MPGKGHEIGSTEDDCSQSQATPPKDETGIKGSREMSARRGGLKEYKEQLAQLEKSLKQELQRLKS